MSYEAWIMIFGIALSNLFVLIGGLIHTNTRLTRIEIDIAWLKKNGTKCQPTSENLLK